MSSPNGDQDPTVHHGRLIPIGLINPQPHDLQRFDDEDPQLEDLIATMRETGQLQPIIVRTDGDRYALIVGSRRWRAARALGWPEIRADVYPRETKNTSAMTLVENLARRNLTPVEESIGCATLLAENDNRSEVVAKLLGRSPRWVEQRAALTQLPEDLLHALHAGKIRIAHAEALARLTSHDIRARLLATVVEQTPPSHLVTRWVDEACQQEQGPCPVESGPSTGAAAEPMPSRGVPCACCARLTTPATCTAIVVCVLCADDIRTATQTPQPSPPVPGV